MLVEVPCCIGDKCYSIKRNGNTYYTAAGVVSQIEFVKQNKNDRKMTLIIVSKGHSRGEWGKIIFGNKKDCDEECARRNKLTKAGAAENITGY